MIVIIIIKNEQFLSLIYKKINTFIYIDRNFST